MDELEPSVFDARRFFAQVRRGGLDLPDRAEGAEVEAQAWGENEKLEIQN